MIIQHVFIFHSDNGNMCNLTAILPIKSASHCLHKLLPHIRIFLACSGMRQYSQLPPGIHVPPPPPGPEHPMLSALCSRQRGTRQSTVPGWVGSVSVCVAFNKPPKSPWAGGSPATAIHLQDTLRACLGSSSSLYVFVRVVVWPFAGTHRNPG